MLSGATVRAACIQRRGGFAAAFDRDAAIAWSRLMTIPTLQYRGHELRAYSHQTFPPFGDPYAPGAKRFAAFVRIDSTEHPAEPGRRYATPLEDAHPETFGDAIEIAMQYGRDIIDGKVHAQQVLGRG
jgi:hypothetical protein